MLYYLHIIHSVNLVKGYIIIFKQSVSKTREDLHTLKLPFKYLNGIIYHRDNTLFINTYINYNALRK